jgi:hypothetical protein
MIDSLIATKEIQFVIKNLPQKNKTTPGSDGITEKFYQYERNKIVSILHRVFWKEK